MSGETTVRISRSAGVSVRSKWSRSTGFANRRSSGPSKKPWIRAACRSTLMTRSAPAGVEQVGDEAGADRLAAAALLVCLARVRMARGDDGDALGRRALGRVDHDQRLHQPLVDRLAEGLDQEQVAAPDRHLEPGVDLTRGEGAVLGGRDLGAERGGDGLRQLGMGAPVRRSPAASSSWRRVRARCRCPDPDRPSSSCAPLVPTPPLEPGSPHDRSARAGPVLPDPALDVALRRDAHGQGTGGHILADRGAGACLRARTPA